MVLPKKSSRDKEMAAYDYIGPSDFEIYPNGLVRMATDSKQKESSGEK